MIVDVHTHLWEMPEQLGPASAERIRALPLEPWERPDASPSSHDRAMKPVRYAFVLGLVSKHIGATIDAKQVARYVARQPHKNIGFVSIDPTSDGYLDELETAAGLGLAGVTICPEAQNFHPTDRRAMALFERCAARKWPVLVQTGTHLSPAGRMEFGQPHLFDDVARALPELRIVIAQAGYPWVDAGMVLLGKHAHVYGDLSHLSARPWQLRLTLLAAHEQGVANKLLLGSDFPFCTPDQAIHNIFTAAGVSEGAGHSLPGPRVPREVLRAIVERDALALLGVARPTAPPPPEESVTHIIDMPPVSTPLQGELQ